jgi:hypothetical protein
MLKKLWFLALCIMSALAVSMTALAQNPHFIGEPTATDLGTRLQVRGSVAGLGNRNIDVIVRATGTASVDCVNPGGNVVPGQHTSVTTTATATNIEVRNGRANFTLTTAAPTVDPAEACPNRRWMARVTDVVFESFTITVIQPSGSGNVVLQETFLVQ